MARCNRGWRSTSARRGRNRFFCRSVRAARHARRAGTLPDGCAAAWNVRVGAGGQIDAPAAQDHVVLSPRDKQAPGRARWRRSGRPADAAGAAAHGSADIVRQAAQGLSPAYFALVMATGIVSVDAHLLDMPRIAAALFWLNIVAYLV